MLNLDKYQVDWVCKHLGHIKSVHKAHYQQMSDFIERVHIAKLLLVQDMNLTKQFKGKKLEDIDVSGKYCVIILASIRWLVCIQLKHWP